MLLAVNSGRSQPVRSVLSRRRSMRRLRLASLPCKVAFTRNPSGLRVLQMLATISNPGKAERFRVFYEIPPPTTGGFAWLRARERRVAVQRTEVGHGAVAEQGSV